jgi:radical SAM superfamily enzyme YgiQ (UPF0313 family)
MLAKHMPNKALPSSPEIWPQMVEECYGLFHEESWLPVASLVLGLPGETDDDVVKTIELVESLRSYTGLMLPLFFTPMDETHLGGAQGLGRMNSLPEHWELVGICLEYNLRHLKKLHKLYSERMTIGPLEHMALYGTNLLADRVLKKYVSRMKRGDPPN